MTNLNFQLGQQMVRKMSQLSMEGMKHWSQRSKMEGQSPVLPVTSVLSLHKSYSSIVLYIKYIYIVLYIKNYRSFLLLRVKMKNKIKLVGTKWNMEEVFESLNEVLSWRDVTFRGFSGFLGNIYLQSPILPMSPCGLTESLPELLTLHCSSGWEGHTSNICRLC